MAKKSGSKKKRRKAGRKGRRGTSHKAEKRSKKRKARKSSKRSRAAKKAARTRAAKKAARSAAAKKAYRARKRKGGGKKRKSSKGKRKAHRAKKSHRKSRRKSHRRVSPDRVYKKALAEGNRHERAAAKLRKQYDKALAANKHRSAAQVEKLRKHQEKLAQRLKYHEGMAAEMRRTHKNKKRRGKGRRRNPITGWGESASALAGVAVGGLSLVLVNALISNRGNLQNTGGVLSDQPAAGGGVYLLEAQSLPVWKQFKHAGGYRILWALTNIGGPLVAAHYLGKAGHKKWATFFDGWGYTDSGIAVAKLTTDGVAALFGKKAFAMKLVPAQLVALNATAAAQASNLPLAAAPIAAGTSGKLGYATTGAQSVLGAGKEPGCPHVGAGQACCNACSKGGAPGRPQPGQAGPPAQYPPGNFVPRAPSGPGTVTGLPDNPPGGTTGNGATAPGGMVTGAQGAGRSNVVEIAHPAFRDRMPKKRSFDRRY